MERIFQILAVILAVVVAFFLWRNDGDWAFFVGVLAACSFILSIRFQIMSRIGGLRPRRRTPANEKGEAEHNTPA